MDKYNDWLNQGWRQLVNDFCEGHFRPQNESDIKCHLYCSLFKVKSQIKGLTPNHLVLSEFQLPASQEKIDLVLVRWRAAEQVPHARLIVELKETSQAHLRSKDVEERIKDDIDKLRRYKRMLQDRQETKILKFFKTPVVAFFFRGAGKHGIRVKTFDEMKKVEEKYNDISFLWGPAN